MLSHLLFYFFIHLNLSLYIYFSYRLPYSTVSLYICIIYYFFYLRPNEIKMSFTTKRPGQASSHTKSQHNKMPKTSNINNQTGEWESLNLYKNLHEKLFSSSTSLSVIFLLLYLLCRSFLHFLFLPPRYFVLSPLPSSTFSILTPHLFTSRIHHTKLVRDIGTSN